MKDQKPALFILHGTGFALSHMKLFFAPWERDFTIVHWDQPGAGQSYVQHGTPESMTLDGIARDGIAVVEQLNVARVILLGASGGSMIGLKMARARPDLFSAYIGCGQFVNWAKQTALGYAMILDRARASGDSQAIAELTAIGPPPYRDIASAVIHGKYASAMTAAEQAVFSTLDPAALAEMRTPYDGRAVSLAAFTKLMDEIHAFDARLMGLHFDVPMYFFQGQQDAYSVTSEVAAYEAEIDAPAKALKIVEGAGHSLFFMREEMLSLLKATVSDISR